MQPIQPQLERRLIDGFFDAARTGLLEKALTDLGSFVTGRPGFVVFAGHAMVAIGSGAPLLGPNGPLQDQPLSAVNDPVLHEIGMEWVRVNDTTPAGHRAIVGALVLRAGLLCRMLDRAYRHLEGRESGGKPILQHQLVKACFVESYGVAEQIRQEAVPFLDDSLAIDFDALHRALSDATMKASKLMGGHGYLLGEVNSIEFLSMCLAGHAAQSSAANEQANVTVPAAKTAPTKELVACPS
ncbi:MAG: hypothetical protein ACSHXB_16085 [Sulfitobacter sp.]